MNGGCEGGDGLEGRHYYEGAPVSRLRRRCRSEGLERSPYDYVLTSTLFRTDGTPARQKSHSPNKSRCLPNGQDNFVHISSFPSLDGVEFAVDGPAAIGDMDGQRRNFRSSPPRSPPKFHIELPNKADHSPLHREDRLPRVEELLEKFDADLMDFTIEPVAKQPLKSILNNPRKSPPPGILKKKSKVDSKTAEGRRRQRALSESEYNYMEGNKSHHESHLHNIANLKRMKDNSGTMHYGTPYDHTRNLSPKPNPLTMYFSNPYDHHKRQDNQKLHDYGLKASPKRESNVINAYDHLQKVQGSPKRDSAYSNSSSPTYDLYNKVHGSPNLLNSHESRKQGSPKRDSAYSNSSSPTHDLYNKVHGSPKEPKFPHEGHKPGCPKGILNFGQVVPDCHRPCCPKGPSNPVNDRKGHESPERPQRRVSLASQECSPYLKAQLSPKGPVSQYGNGHAYDHNGQSPVRNGEVRQEPHILRTTAIGVRADEGITTMPLPDPVVPAPTGPSGAAVADAGAGVTSRATLKKVVRKVRKVKKVKSKVLMKCKKAESGDAHVENGIIPSPDLSPPPSPRVPSSAVMETDSVQVGKSVDQSRNGQTIAVKSRRASEKISNGTVAIGESSMTIPEALSPVIRPSLFPQVPPYLKFVGHDETPSLKPPLALGKHLKWKLTSITPIVVKKTLINSGFKLVKSECDTSECPQDETVDWIGIWGKHMKSIMFRGIKDSQKMNHFPGTFQIGRKDRLWRNLQRLVARHGSKEFGIMPKTYVLPHDMKLLKRDWEKYAARNEKWIIKPPASARGTGIAVVARWAEIPKKRSVVVQRYISKPLLINGSKFDLRLYVLVTSVHPLRIFLFNDGLARFASAKYTDELSSLHDRYMHLTNYSINRLSKNYAANEDASACQGHKWTLQTLFQYLERERKVNTTALWERLKDLVIKTILCGESSIRALTEANITSQYNCYELFGVDVLLDEELKPWLLEVNISPSLHSSSPLDVYVKGPLVSAVLNIAQFHVPNRPSSDASIKDNKNGYKYASVSYDNRLYTVYLSKEERDKHIIYTKMEDREDYLTDILSSLTPDDVRHLIRSEDELAAGAATAAMAGSGPHMERIFPTPYTHKYLEFLAAPRYYNRLLDAWECKYRHDRSAGIHLLRSLCEMSYHLEVPPVPLKRAAAPELAFLVDGCRVRRATNASWRPAVNTRRCHWRWSQRPPTARGRASAASASLCTRRHDAGA